MLSPTNLGIVIRKNGQVPIDKQPDGSDHPHRAHILAALRGMGHKLLHEDHCDHHNGGACGCSPTIHNWTPPGA